jgi:TPR repeat protein
LQGLQLLMGPVKDSRTAASFLRQACDLGGRDSCAHLGGLYEAGDGVSQNLAEAIHLYTESCAARYNAQLLPASVLVCGDRAEITTEREQLKDIAGRFRVPPRLLAASFGSPR